MQQTYVALTITGGAELSKATFIWKTRKEVVPGVGQRRCPVGDLVLELRLQLCLSLVLRASLLTVGRDFSLESTLPHSLSSLAQLPPPPGVSKDQSENET